MKFDYYLKKRYYYGVGQVDFGQSTCNIVVTNDTNKKS